MPGTRFPSRPRPRAADPATTAASRCEAGQITMTKSMTRRQLITQTLQQADSPLTMREIDAALCAHFGYPSTPETKQRTAVALSSMQKAGLVEGTGPRSPRSYRLPVPGTVSPPATWRPLKVDQPYRRELRNMPGLKIGSKANDPLPSTSSTLPPRSTVSVTISPPAAAESEPSPPPAAKPAPSPIPTPPRQPHPHPAAVRELADAVAEIERATGFMRRALEALATTLETTHDRHG